MTMDAIKEKLLDLWGIVVKLSTYSLYPFFFRGEGPKGRIELVKKRRISMKRKTLFITTLALAAAFFLAAIQPAVAAERIVKLRIPACG